MKLLPAAAATALLLLAGSASAQTTHEVQVVGPGFGGFFSPQDLKIMQGDTVRWVWVSGFHDVTSGQGGAPNGIFTSITTFPPHTFEVTFDAGFLAANPVPANRYDYFCSIHVTVGMIGSITVDVPSSVTNYGCINPAASLVHISGAPVPGQTLTLGVDNPLGTQPGGSVALLAVATTPLDLGGGCGLPVPGWGMSAPGAAGEILIGISGIDPFLTLGPQAWAGAGTPSAFPVGFPLNPNLVGLPFYFQGGIVDPGGGSGIPLGLTEGIVVVVGNC